MILEGKEPETGDDGREPVEPGSQGRFSILGLGVYIVGTCALFVAFEKLGCRLRGLGQGRSWAEIQERLPETLLFGAGAGAVLYVFRWLRERKR